MTPKQQLLLHIETLPDPIIEELLDFLMITLIRYHRQQQTLLPLGQFIRSDHPGQNGNVKDSLGTDRRFR